MFLGAGTRFSPAFSFRQDRFKLNADYRWQKGLTAAAGVDWDELERSYQDVVKTHEATVWARGTMKPRDNLELSLKLAHADRTHSTYRSATGVEPPQSPLFRKCNHAPPRRNPAQPRRAQARGARTAAESFGSAPSRRTRAWRWTAPRAGNSATFAYRIRAAVPPSVRNRRRRPRWPAWHGRGRGGGCEAFQATGVARAWR